VDMFEAARRTSAWGHGLPARLHRRHGRYTPDSRRLAAAPELAALGPIADKPLLPHNPTYDRPLTIPYPSAGEDRSGRSCSIMGTKRARESTHGSSGEQRMPFEHNADHF
jgi:hypothetical protein